MSRIFLVFSVLTLLFIPQIAFAKELKYWYSDTNRIGKVKNHYLSYRNYKGGFTNSDFLKYLKHARSQWSAAGIKTFNGGDNQWTNTINWYGGSKKKLESIEPKLKNFAAITVIDHTPLRTDTYKGKKIYNRKILKAKVYTPKKLFYSAKNYRIMFTHELGHALGYLGHSTSKNDLMYSSGKKDVLTTRDKRHLSQNY